MMVVGARFAVEQPNGIEFSVLGDAGTFKLSTDANGGGSLSGIDSTVQQLRLGVAGAVNNRYDWGTLRPYGQLALRVDDGDGITGEWIEVSGGLAVSSGRWTIDGGVWTLLGGSEDDYKETGMQFTVKMNPKVDGSGASVQLGAGVASEVQNVEAILSSKALGEDADTADYAVPIRARAGYGFRFANWRNSLFTPFVQHLQEPSGERRVGMGLGLVRQPGNGNQASVNADLSADRIEQPSGAEKSDISMRFELRYDF